MKKVTSALLILLLFHAIHTVSGQSGKEKPKGQTFRIAFYNVENLFDTIDDPAVNDEDFLPGSRIPWTSERYMAKIDRISQVIVALAGTKPVAVMGLCEVENAVVLEDLVNSRAMLPYGYKVIHFDSPDERGIDNALLYDPEQFRPVSMASLPVDLSSIDGDKTRDILYVKGLPDKSKHDTLHIFINHWPSRTGGQEASAPKRALAARTLKNAADSLMKFCESPLIVIMGDFNDEPADNSISEVLGALPPSASPDAGNLYNFGYPALNEGKGTLYYKDWDVFDQVILSGGILLNKKGIVFHGDQEVIFDPEWLMYKDNEGNLRPNRTAAREYYGGYSDHLPVYVDLEAAR